MKFLKNILFLGLSFLIVGEVKAASMEIKDVVTKVRERDTDYKVSLSDHAGIYVINKSNKNHANLVSAMRGSFEKSSKITFKANPETMEILEIVPK